MEVASLTTEETEVCEGTVLTRDDFVIVTNPAGHESLVTVSPLEFNEAGTVSVSATCGSSSKSVYIEVVGDVPKPDPPENECKGPNFVGDVRGSFGRTTFPTLPTVIIKIVKVCQGDSVKYRLDGSVEANIRIEVDTKITCHGNTFSRSQQNISRTVQHEKRHCDSLISALDSFNEKLDETLYDSEESAELAKMTIELFIIVT